MNEIGKKNAIKHKNIFQFKKIKKELIGCTEKYVVDNITKEVIAEKNKPLLFWGDKYNKARECLFSKIENPEVMKTIIKSSNKIIVEKTTKYKDAEIETIDEYIGLIDDICKNFDVSVEKIITSSQSTQTMKSLRDSDSHTEVREYISIGIDDIDTKKELLKC
ncbi:hypothetical protein Glove_236g20 [Diversispora epigaea]|uniref:Uncharacterized protein n=1 Tax=Diversispora epigaea TaxID=1348612 RepID=A0A397IAL7_9GLOM|nr:hypothetical protein Glove_236g20 [Diversispora epigaea]